MVRSYLTSLSIIEYGIATILNNTAIIDKSAT